MGVGNLLSCVVDEADFVASPWSRGDQEALLASVTSVKKPAQLVFVGATASGGVYDILDKFSSKCVLLE